MKKNRVLLSYVCSCNVDLRRVSEDTSYVWVYSLVSRYPSWTVFFVIDLTISTIMRCLSGLTHGSKVANETFVVTLNRVPTSATASDIKKAYYKLSLK